MPEDNNKPLEKQLYQILSNTFSIPELRDICHNLGIDWENLQYRDRKNDVAREIVQYCSNRNQLNQLSNTIAEKRPSFFTSPNTEPSALLDGKKTESKDSQTPMHQSSNATPILKHIKPLNFAIFITMIIIALLIGWGISSCSGQDAFNYQVRVEDNRTNEPVANANVALDVAGISSLTGITGDDGRASIQVLPDYANQTGRIIVAANGYDTYRSEILLTDESLPTVIQLQKLEPTPTPTLPSPTPTNTRKATATFTELPATSTPTMTPTSTPGLEPSATPTLSATITLTPTNTIAPLPPIEAPEPPQLTSPIGTTQKNPIEFSWDGPNTVSYQVTLRNAEKEYQHVSGWIQGNIWTFNIPDGKYGAIEWFVTSSAGARSETKTFFFDPFDGGGNGDNGGNGGNVTPTFTPPP